MTKATNVMGRLLSLKVQLRIKLAAQAQKPLRVTTILIPQLPRVISGQLAIQLTGLSFDLAKDSPVAGLLTIADKAKWRAIG